MKPMETKILDGALYQASMMNEIKEEVPGKNDASKMIPIIRGGVNKEAVSGIASVLSPVPGGLMQILLAVLFRNAMMAFKYAMQVK